MTPEPGGPPGKVIWAYAYQIVPPQPEDRLRTVKAMLDHEQSDQSLETGTWEGRFVIERQITHILVVSDSPDLDREINRRVEAELRELRTEFSLTVPLAVVDDDALPTE